MNTTTKQTLIEVGKIVSKLTAVIVLAIGAWYAVALGYLWLGFTQVESEALSFGTLGFPLLAFALGHVIWSEAKYRVWKRENNVE